MKRELYKHIASNVAWNRVVPDSFRNECDRRLELCREFLPNGSGIDCGCKIDLDKSEENKLVIHFSFHHMDEWGGYDGWTEHDLYVRPDLMIELKLNILGTNRNGIKDYLYDMFYQVLRTKVEI